MTPSQIADFMASLFSTYGVKNICLLDAEAGIGSLRIAIFETLIAEPIVNRVAWGIYDVDKNLGEK